MPMRGLRNYKLIIPSFPTAGPFAKNRLIFNEEFVTGEIGQVGTQFDGLGHIGVLVGADGDLNGMRFYNGFTGADLVSASGLKKLGDRKSTRLNSSHGYISYAVFCLKKKNKKRTIQ